MTEIVKDFITNIGHKNPQSGKSIALYFGSFNPIHIGHLIIANYIAQQPMIDEVWFIVSPQNPHKNKKNLLADHHRLSMVRIGIEDNPKLRVNDIEFNLPKPSYTVYTLQALKEKYPEHNFTLIMGEDNLRTLHKWRNFEYIIEHYPILVYPRAQSAKELEEIDDNNLSQNAQITLIDAPLMQISSSFIRNMIKNGQEVKYLLSQPVFNYLDEMNFYK